MGQTEWEFSALFVLLVLVALVYRVISRRLETRAGERSEIAERREGREAREEAKPAPAANSSSDIPGELLLMIARLNRAGGVLLEGTKAPSEAREALKHAADILAEMPGEGQQQVEDSLRLAASKFGDSDVLRFCRETAEKFVNQAGALRAGFEKATSETSAIKRGLSHRGVVVVGVCDAHEAVHGCLQELSGDDGYLFAARFMQDSEVQKKNIDVGMKTVGGMMGLSRDQYKLQLESTQGTSPWLICEQCTDFLGLAQEDKDAARAAAMKWREDKGGRGHTPGSSDKSLAESEQAGLPAERRARFKKLSKELDAIATPLTMHTITAEANPLKELALECSGCAFMLDDFINDGPAAQTLKSPSEMPKVLGGMLVKMREHAKQVGDSSEGKKMLGFFLEMHGVATEILDAEKLPAGTSEDGPRRWWQIWK